MDREGCKFCIQPVDHQLVDSQIGRKGKAIRGIGFDAMSVGLLLPHGIDAGAAMLIDGNGRAKPPLFFNSITGDRTAAIVGHHHAATRMIDAQEAWPLAAR